MFFIVIMNCQKLVKPTKKDMHSKNARLAAVSSAIKLPIIKHSVYNTDQYCEDYQKMP